MEKIYILKNAPNGAEKYDYILFNDKFKTRTKVTTTPEKATQAAKKHGYEPISPLDAMDLMKYEKETPEDFFFPF